MLDRIGDMLDEINIKYARLDGTMTREERAKACDALRHNKKVEVLLVSTRAGGVGLNLTAACRCFLVDPYWNPSVEAQAIDRIVSGGSAKSSSTVADVRSSTEWARPARSPPSSS
jgi:SWI/SNF-related matrix-associated actin-dependent regulator of chromatin subfamily A3